MVKADIVRQIEYEHGLEREDARKIVDDIIDSIKGSLISSDSVMISGFGRWKVGDRKKRMGRNPMTLETHEIAPRRVVTFYVSQVWRKSIGHKG